MQSHGIVTYESDILQLYGWSSWQAVTLSKFDDDLAVILAKLDPVSSFDLVL